MKEQAIYQFILDNPLRQLIGKEARDEQNNRYIIRDVSFSEGYKFSVGIERDYKNPSGEILLGITEHADVDLASILKDKIIPQHQEPPS